MTNDESVHPAWLKKWLRVSIVVAIVLALYVYGQDHGLLWHVELLGVNILLYITLGSFSTSFLVGIQLGYVLVLLFLGFFTLCHLVLNLPTDLQVPQCLPIPSIPLKGREVYLHLACCVAAKLGLK
jgi:hypothetical protein